MGLFEHFPYTNFHDLNLDWLLRKVKELLDAKVPAGGNANQVLTKQSNADYDMVWKDAPALPTGGTDGQLLVKNGTADYSARWEDPSEAVGNVVDEEIAKVHQVPAGGTTGQVLTKQSDSDYDATWQDAGGSGGGVPDGGTTGQVLTKKSDTNQDVEWKTVGSGLPAGGTTGQALTKKSNADNDVEWTYMDYLPLDGGIMDEGAHIQIPDSSGNSLTLDNNSITYVGEKATFSGSFGFDQTVTGQPPVNPEDLATKQYVDTQTGGGVGPTARFRALTYLLPFLEDQGVATIDNFKKEILSHFGVTNGILKLTLQPRLDQATSPYVGTTSTYWSSGGIGPFTFYGIKADDGTIVKVGTVQIDSSGKCTVTNTSGRTWTPSQSCRLFVELGDNTYGTTPTTPAV